MRATTAVVALLLLLFGAASELAAQEGAGTVEGVVVSVDDGTPIPFALMRLVPVEPRSVAVQQGITDAGGRFRFTGVTPGDYHLQLLRIGYRPVLSELLRVRPGETLRYELRGPTQAVQLAPVVVRSGPSCLTGAQLTDDPRLAALWSEARKGVETRRAFELQYRFTRILRQDIEVRWRVRRPTRPREVDTLVSEPDSVLAREARRREMIQTRGYAEGNRLVMPDERHLLDDAFLRDHCVETAVEEADGTLGLRFRPVRSRGDLVDIRGTIWVEEGTYQMRRLELEYLDGERPFARGQLDYADVTVGGSAFRLPSSAWATMRPRGASRALASRATGAVAYAYQDFEQVRSR